MLKLKMIIYWLPFSVIYSSDTFPTRSVAVTSRDVPKLLLFVTSFDRLLVECYYRSQLLKSFVQLLLRLNSLQDSVGMSKYFNLSCDFDSVTYFTHIYTRSDWICFNLRSASSTSFWPVLAILLWLLFGHLFNTIYTLGPTGSVSIFGRLCAIFFHL